MGTAQHPLEEGFLAAFKVFKQISAKKIGFCWNFLGNLYSTKYAFCSFYRLDCNRYVSYPRSRTASWGIC